MCDAGPTSAARRIGQLLDERIDLVELVDSGLQDQESFGLRGWARACHDRTQRRRVRRRGEERLALLVVKAPDADLLHDASGGWLTLDELVHRKAWGIGQRGWEAAGASSSSPSLTLTPLPISPALTSPLRKLLPQAGAAPAHRRRDALL
jgi:hypothetical protein